MQKKEEGIMLRTDNYFQKMIFEKKFIHSKDTGITGTYYPTPEYGSGNIRVCLSGKRGSLILIDCSLKYPLSLSPCRKDELYITSFHEATGNRMFETGAVPLVPDRVNISDIRSGISRTVFEPDTRIFGFLLAICKSEYEKHLEMVLHGDCHYLLEGLPALDQKVRDPVIGTISRSMLHFHGDEISSHLFYEGKVDEIISVLISRHPRHRDNPSDRFESTSQVQDFAEAQKIVQYMSAHLSESLTTGELARKFNSSPSRLSSVFKKATNLSLPEYRNLLRVSEARRLLTETNLTQEEIASRVGFSRVSNFSDFFRRMTGETPGALRRGRSGSTPPRKNRLIFPPDTVIKRTHRCVRSVLFFFVGS